MGQSNSSGGQRPVPRTHFNFSENFPAERAPEPFEFLPREERRSPRTPPDSSFGGQPGLSFDSYYEALLNSTPTSAQVAAAVLQGVSMGSQRLPDTPQRAPPVPQRHPPVSMRPLVPERPSPVSMRPPLVPERPSPVSMRPPLVSERPSPVSLMDMSFQAHEPMHTSETEYVGEGPRRRDKPPKEGRNRGGGHGNQGQAGEDGNLGNKAKGVGGNPGKKGQNKGQKGGDSGNQEKQATSNHGNQQKQGDGNNTQGESLNLTTIEDPRIRMEMEKKLASDLRGLLLAQGGQLLVSQVQSALDKLKIRVGSHIEFIRRHCDKFRLSDSGTAEIHKKWVIATTDLKICQKHTSKAGCTLGKMCDSLHVCKFYLLTGSCAFDNRGNKCRYGHTLDAGHNLSLLEVHALDTLPDYCLFTLFRTLLGETVTKLRQLGGNDDASSAGDESEEDSVSVTSQESRGAGARKKTRPRKRKNKDSKGNSNENEKGPIICSFFLLGQCKSGNKCSRSHRALPYQWQFFKAEHRKWVDFPDNVNVELERDFGNPIKDGCSSQIVLAGKKKMPFTVHFDAMMVFFDSNAMQMKVRRLSTNNAATSPGNLPFLTTWIWSWKNDHGSYCKFGKKDSVKDGPDGHPDSKKLEDCYGDDNKGVMQWTSGGFEYIMDFSRMIQINVATNRERKVRRRPHQFWNATLIDAERKRIKTNNSRTQEKKQGDQKKERTAEDNDLPQFWDLFAKSDSDFYQLVPITKGGATFHEYEKIETQFFESLSRDQFRISGIRRIQNPDLYRGFQFAKSRMARKASSDAAVEEKFLFHGTRQEYMEAICHQGFDFRVSGSTTGCLYGRGSYFAKEANYSRHYTDCSQLIVARVLVGQYTKGESFYTRPPPRDPNRPHGQTFDSCVDDMKNPKIFVVFSIEQSYPEYLIDFHKV